MRVLFRADASLEIGTGHIMRCLTLADALRTRGGECTFVSRPHKGHLLELIAKRGHSTIALPTNSQDFIAPNKPAHAAWLGAAWRADVEQTRQALSGHKVDWLVVDHYALDHQWEHSMRDIAEQIMVIDDLADRSHDCDLLLDQNLGRNVKDYDGMLPKHAKTFVGPRYALLRPEFVQARPLSLARRGKATLTNLLITLGGVDKDNVTGKVLEALHAAPLPADLKITVVMGPHAPWLNNVTELSAQMPWPTKVLSDVSNMAELMINHDLAIGAAGATSWERCCLGVPTIITVLAENQITTALALERSGAALVADQIELIPSILQKLMSDQGQGKLVALSEQASVLTDGLGVQHFSNLICSEHASKIFD